MYSRYKMEAGKYLDENLKWCNGSCIEFVKATWH